MPSALIDVLDAPCPFLIGIHRESLDEVFMDETTLENCVRVDLDHDKIEQTELAIYQ